MKKLSLDNVENLYAFTKAHFVEWYDLQTELVDHLANDIEDMWKEQPKLSFEEAKQKAFKKFGVLGFMEVVEKRQKAMNKRYLKYLWQELKKWFEIPQILATIVLFLCLFVVFSSKYTNLFALICYTLILLWSVYKRINLNRQFRRRKEISNKKWLLEEIIFKQTSGTMLLFLSLAYNVYNVSGKLMDSTYGLIALSIGFTMLTLINYISFELIPKKAEYVLEKTYPEYKIL